MYMRTAEGLAQVTMRYGHFAGTLGDHPLPSVIQNFLARVKGNPQNYEAVLLITKFHGEPFISDQLRRVFLASVENDAKDPLGEAKAIQVEVTQALENIYQKHLKDNRFSQLVKNEQQLIAVVAKASQKRIEELKTKGWLEPILIDVLLADFPFGVLQVGRAFVLSTLSNEIAEQILNSRVPETYYMRLGKVLLLMAEQRQKDGAFNKRVEQERKKRAQ